MITAHSVSPTDADTSVYISDQDRDRYLTLKERGTRDLRATGELEEYQQLRGAVAACHRFAEPALEEMEPEPAPTTPGKYVHADGTVAYACFVNAPGAFRVVYLKRGSTCTSSGIRPRVSRPRARQRRDGSRRHSTRGGTGDEPGDQSPGDLPDAPLERACAICGTDIGHRRADAQTCENDAHKKQWQRDRRKQAEDAVRPAYTGCQECGRRWLSDLPARTHTCPCGGGLQIGTDIRSPREPLCRCNGHHVLDASDGDCVKCGLPYREDVAPYYLALWERTARRGSQISSSLANAQATAVAA